MLNEIKKCCLQLPDFQRKSLIRVILGKSKLSSSQNDGLRDLLAGIGQLSEEAKAEVIKLIVEIDQESDKYLAGMKRRNLRK